MSSTTSLKRKRAEGHSPTRQSSRVKSAEQRVERETAERVEEEAAAIKESLTHKYDKGAQRACEQDDSELMQTTLEAATRMNEHEEAHLKSYGLTMAMRHGALEVLKFLLSGGVRVDQVTSVMAHNDGKPTMKVLQYLLNEGWDIDTRALDSSGKEAQPLLWHAMDNEPFVDWCLSKGASVSFEEQPLTGDPLSHEVLQAIQENAFPPLLENVAAYGTIATFKKLRAKGAPLGRRTLHKAVSTAAKPWPRIRIPGGKGRTRSNPQSAIRREMLEFLLDDVVIDINVSDRPPDCFQSVPQHHGSPLCYAAATSLEHAVPYKFIKYMLERGAGHVEALIHCDEIGAEKFASAIETWVERKTRPNGVKAPAKVVVASGR